MKLNPEQLHYDLRFEDLDNTATGILVMDDEPADVQFHTNRLQRWKKLLQDKYLSGKLKHLAAQNMHQLTVPGQFSVCMYTSGKVMVQGLEWAEQDFP